MKEIFTNQILDFFGKINQEIFKLIWDSQRKMLQNIRKDYLMQPYVDKKSSIELQLYNQELIINQLRIYAEEISSIKKIRFIKSRMMNVKPEVSKKSKTYWKEEINFKSKVIMTKIKMNWYKASLKSRRNCLREAAEQAVYCHDNEQQALYNIINETKEIPKNKMNFAESLMEFQKIIDSIRKDYHLKFIPRTNDLLKIWYNTLDYVTGKKARDEEVGHAKLIQIEYKRRDKMEYTNSLNKFNAKSDEDQQKENQRLILLWDIKEIQRTIEKWKVYEIVKSELSDIDEKLQDQEMMDDSYKRKIDQVFKEVKGDPQLRLNGLVFDLEYLKVPEILRRIKGERKELRARRWEEYFDDDPLGPVGT
jgi:hypothetical protein